MFRKLLEWDSDTFVYLNGLGTKEYDFFWATITNIYTWIPLLLLFFILIFVRYPKKEALFMSLTIIALMLFIIAITDLTKEFVARLRPNNEEAINSIIRILKRPVSYSFFSGHASSSFSITTLVVLFLRKKIKWVWLFYLWPILFTSSRIYIGVHYPLDIIFGASIGILSALLFFNLYNIYTRFS